jgi:hypothetical protein
LLGGLYHDYLMLQLAIEQALTHLTSLSQFHNISLSKRDSASAVVSKFLADLESLYYLCVILFNVFQRRTQNDS